MFYPMHLGGGDVPGMGGNNGYLAQARLNPLTDPRNKIKYGEGWGLGPTLPFTEPERGPQNWKPLLPPGQPSVPLAYSNGSPSVGNAGVDAKALADFQTLLNQDTEARPWNNPKPQIPVGFVMSGLY
jgi:hypothetical protein